MDLSITQMIHKSLMSRRGDIVDADQKGRFKTAVMSTDVDFDQFEERLPSSASLLLSDFQQSFEEEQERSWNSWAGNNRWYNPRRCCETSFLQQDIQLLAVTLILVHVSKPGPRP